MATVQHAMKYSLTEQEMKKDSKVVTFYKNGDMYFSGYVVTITSRRYRSFEVLLSELSRITNLPQGVRYLLDQENGTKVEAIEQLRDGKAYVCASNSKLKRLDYGKKAGALAQWGSRNKIELPAITNPPRVHGNQSFRYAGNTRRMETKERRTEVPKLDRTSYKARNVTVIRNGHKPRLSTRVLLNKRTAHSVNQFLDIVNDVFGVTGSSNVRKLYTSKGKQIYEVSDLFNDEEGVFIAVGNERFRVDEVDSILSEDNKGTTALKRANRTHHGKVGNHGMTRDVNNRENKQETKEHEVRLTENKSRPDRTEDNALPKLPAVSDKTSPSNHITSPPAEVPDNHDRNRSTVQQAKPKSPKHTKKAVSKQTNHTSRHIDRKNDINPSTVKLPQIGTGQNMVSSQEQHQTTKKISKPKKSNDAQNSSPRRTDEKLSESIESNKSETIAEEKKKKKSSKDSSGTSLEVEYCRVTDKSVDDVYHIGRKLGDGNFAIVRQCTNKTNKKNFALKIIDKKKIQGKEKMIDDEISIMRKCRHANIVRLYEDYDTQTEIFLVMELVEGGDLFDAISASVKFTEDVTRTYFRDMCKALAYLHKLRIVHRDMKPENLLVQNQPNGQTILKLADFGLAVEVKVPLFTVCGTPTYVAPEILEEEGYGLKIDMWAAGVITYIMLCGFPPFRSAKRDQDELFDLIQEGDYDFLSPYWDPISDDAKDLISHLLVVEPGKRFSSEKALAHKWVRYKSPSVDDLSQHLLGNDNNNNKAKRKFKAAALAVKGAKRFENLAEEFRHHRGEKFISI